MSLPSQAAALARRYGALDGSGLIRAIAIEGPLAGKSVLVSSFGAESAVLLHMVASLDRHFPVIFLDTLKHFPATLSYRQQLVERLGLTNLRTATPDLALLGRADPEDRLNATDPDQCCDIRKTLPLEQALRGFDGWITGRKRFQGGARLELPVIEADPTAERVKLNPLASWDAAHLAAYRDEHSLPAHPLTAHGYASVGCAPCTRAVAANEGARAGRWFGMDKIECGIHVGGGRAPERRAA